MVEQALPWVWVVVAVVAGTVAVRARTAVGDRPLPTSLAVGATFAAAAGFVASSPVVQVTCLVVATLVLAVVFVRWQRLAADDRLPAGVGGNRLAGMDGTVVAPVSSDPGTGRVRIGTETWRARTPDDVDDDASLAPGTAVTVVGVRGTVVVVTPVGATPVGATDVAETDDPANPRLDRSSPSPQSPTTGTP